MPFRCREKECAKRFSVRVGTVMEGSNLDYQVWAIAIYMMVTNIKGISSMKLHRDLDITQKSAWHLAHRLRKSFESKGSMEFAGPVEVDETYMGGKERNEHESKKLRQGRGAVGKEAVMGIKERNGQIHAKHIQSTDAETLQGEIHENVEQGSVVYSDEHKGYLGLGTDYNHQTVKHSIGEYVNGMAHTNGIESFWALMKRGYHGTYHKMSPKHLNRYVGEFAVRHNIRKADTIDQMAGVTTCMEGKRLRYADLVADNGLESGARS